jgi:hypothetical protein
MRCSEGLTTRAGVPRAGFRRQTLLAAVVCALAGSGSSAAAAGPAGARALQACVADAATQVPIAGARVSVGRLVVAADERGCFTLVLPDGATSLLLTAAGYAPLNLPVPAGPFDPATLSMTRQPSFSEHVDVAGAREAAPERAALLRVRPAEVAAVAGGLENVFRVLQTLPGVAATEDFGSRLAVRGGGPDQNLTVMDGVEIHNPYRLFGLTSAFNPETVARFELSAGAFDARHGDRLSSLLVVENRAGREERAFAGSSAVSLTDGNVLLEGRLPGPARGAWLFTARRTYYDLVAERFTDDDLPSFADVQGKLVWNPRPGQRLTAFGLRSRERTDAVFEFDRPGEGGTFLTGARNDLAALTYDGAWGARVAARTVLSWYRNTDDLDVDAQARNEASRSNAPDDVEGFTQANIVFTRALAVRDVALRQELSLQAGPRLLLESGVEWHRLRTSVAWRITGDRNPGAANGSSVQGGAGLPDQLDSARPATRTGAWLQARWQPLARLQLRPGLRLDHSSVNGRAELAPRLLSAWSLAARTRLRLAGGLYTQSPGYEKLIQSDYFLDLSGNGPLALRHERSWQGLLGFEQDLAGGGLLRVEGYYKSFSDLTIGRLETGAERDARLADYDFPPALVGERPSALQIGSDPESSGRGRAYGVDLYLARADDGARRLSGWIAYTLGRAERTAYGRTFPFEYDRRHALSVVAQWRPWRRFDLALTGRFASGFPRTPVVRLRVADRADVSDRDGDGNTTERIPAQDAAGRLVYTTDRGGVEHLNSVRLPSFARVDARATFHPRGRTGRWTLYLDIINVTNRKNAGLLDARLEHDPQGERPRLVEEPSGALPFLPSFGVRFAF